MKNTKRYHILIIVMYLLSVSLVSAQETEDLLSENQVRYTYGFLPYTSIYAAITPALFLPYDTSKYFSASTLVLGGIPNAVIQPQKGLTAMSLSSVSFATAFAFESFDDIFIDNYIAWPLLNIGQKTQMWAYYDGYQTARMNYINSDYANNFERVKFEELLIAPWKMENITRPSVWVPVLGATTVFTLINLLSDNSNSLWETGNAYLGDKQVSIPLGILATIAISLINNTYTAIGEEAVFRGIGYEEFKQTSGTIPAITMDCLLFTAMHIPSEVQEGDSLTELMVNSSLRIGLTIGLDHAYDDGGLEASVAQHMWLDMVFNVITYLFTAGIPQS